jgi:hypothetical protein
MLAAAVVVLMMAAPLELLEPEVLVAAVTVQMAHHPAQERLAPQIQAVAVAVVAHLQILLQLLAQAAPALSSSSTTSALPQSSPSSHRRSGLHQRVR